eukprot:TRINITY_DN5703_c0_g2_i4.p1 TRINITY_DN5703_c0_g2~~TRINITY_DN5703_c0_g2_i4.p1  ORF type:complete len:220 (+),score=22.53 TRINITY_DN5703_c0_g2_i4:89-748(+)
MAPRSAVVIQHKGATIYINNEELLKSVVVALGLAPCDSAGHSLAKSSTASASDAEMFEIFSDKSVENAEQGVQACQALPLMLDAQTQTDVSPDLECERVPETAPERPLHVDQCVGTFDPVFYQADVLTLIDSKVAEVNAQCKTLHDDLVQCRADLLRVSQSRDSLVLKVKQFEDKFPHPDKVTCWADAVPLDDVAGEPPDALDAASEDRSRNKKKGKRK